MPLCIFQSHFSVTCEAVLFTTANSQARLSPEKGKPVHGESKESWTLYAHSPSELPECSSAAQRGFSLSSATMKVPDCNSFIPKMTAFQINPPLNFTFNRTCKHNQENKHAQTPPPPLYDTLLSTREMNFSSVNPGVVLTDLF